MTEPIGCGGELQWQSIADPGILSPGIELVSEFEEMRCPILDDAVHHNRIANALEISFYDYNKNFGRPGTGFLPRA
ncbi:hypothetical protein, partial [Rhizobium johnstonii]|uniref:hypothetical protein n=1 Tax=Rhizobium johnstonii TaxID=3019933 RepID=UPI003F9C5C09